MSVAKIDGKRRIGVTPMSFLVFTGVGSANAGMTPSDY